MGTHFFKPTEPRIGASNLNLQARALNAPSYAGSKAGMGQQKDVAAAAALKPLMGTQKDAASNAPGPKKV